jgi:hypothetical protein
MHNLPFQDKLPVERLASCFKNVTNSYKYYWFLAILEQLEKKPDASQFSVRDLALQMLSLVWYPLDFYKLSFGKQDSFKPIAETVSKYFHPNILPSAPDLYQQLQQELTLNELKSIANEVQQLVRYVPYRFQRPFVEKETRQLKDTQVNRAIVELTAKYFSSSDGMVMYRYIENEATIEFHPLWLSYLQRNLYTMRRFIYFELVCFLQKHNPHVPGLSEKLFRPRSRNLSPATKFWKLYLQNNNYTCPYSSISLNATDFTLDHFVPWSYVAHDSLWNLLPVPQTVNSSKSNSLPSLPIYLSKFSSRQFQAFSFLLSANIQGKSLLLEDYVQLFGQDLSGLHLAGEETFINKLHETIRPLIQVAGNLGFRQDWCYVDLPSTNLTLTPVSLLVM